MGKRGAAGGAVGNGVVFLYMFSKGDRVIEQGVEWLDAIRAEVGQAKTAAKDAVKLEQIKPRDPNWEAKPAFVKWQRLAEQIKDLGEEVTREGSKLEAAQLTEPLGGLPEGYTLVFFGHGTGSDSDDTGGITIEEAKGVGGHVIKGSKEVVVFQHLESMKLSGGKLELSGSPTTDQDEVRRRIPIVQALRDSEFNQIYLAACGNAAPGHEGHKTQSSRLKKFAERLAALTGKLIYYNDQPFYVEPIQPLEFVSGDSGPLRKGDEVLIHGVVSKGKTHTLHQGKNSVSGLMVPVKGTAYVGGASVEMTSKPGDPFVYVSGGPGYAEPATWLPGSTSRATP